jgi:two-component system response regulator QseB
MPWHTFGNSKDGFLHNPKMHILLIEDDMGLGGALQQALKLEGISSEWLRRTVVLDRG